jgi:cytochrome P450
MESRIKEITNGLLDQLQNVGEMDVIRDLAYPLPITVIAELLGIPAERREDFKQWSDASVSGDEDLLEENAPGNTRTLLTLSTNTSMLPRENIRL